MGYNVEMDTPEGETLLESARRAGVRIAGACGGQGCCGGCLVRVVSGTVAAVAKDAEEPLPGQWVRACRVTPTSACSVEIHPRAAAPRAGDGAGEHSAVIACVPRPLVHRYRIEAVPASLGGTTADLERVAATLGGGIVTHSDLGALRQLPSLLRTHDWRLDAIVRTGELIGCRPAGRPLLGLAVDFGSTNAAAFLIDLESGRLLACLGLENPQGRYGADVITRIGHAVRTPHGTDELRQVSVAALESCARDLCAQVAAEPEDIADVAVCGNTAMQHLLLGLPVAPLARAPFVPTVTGALDVKARDLGLPVMAGAYLHLMPGVGGFVGGDHVAALLASEPVWSDAATTLVMDIGTNTELSLIHGGKIVTASTASGPALEGGHISAGMRAAAGAIDQVRLEAGELRCRVMGGGAALGLCGSGVIDALAAFIEAGIVDRRGSIRPDGRYVRKEGAQAEVALAPEVAFTQGDVRAVQLAKAAIRAGIDMLLQEAGLQEGALERLVIAGAFGAGIHIPSAVAVGLLPPLPPDRFRKVGNAAGDGVGMVLISADVREQAKRLARRCRHLELNTLPGFQKAFMGRIGF